MPRNRVDLEVLDYEELHDPAWNQKEITATSNAAVSAPFPLVYLWIFERPDSMCTQLVAHGWACLGPVHMLVSPDARVEGPVMRSRHDIQQAMNHFAKRPGRFQCPKFIDFEQHHSYLGYPINYLRCHSSVWQDAFRMMTSRCRCFVVDLTTDERPTGLLFELEYLFNTVSATDIILMLDASRAKLDVVRSFVLKAWHAMERHSMNRRAGQAPPPLIAYKTYSLRYLVQATRSQWTGKCTVPLAQRAAHYANWI